MKCPACGHQWTAKHSTFIKLRNQAICDDYRLGKSFDALSEQYNVSRSSIYQITRDWHPASLPIGHEFVDRNIAIGQFIDGGGTLKEASAKWGISRSRISEIAKRWALREGMAAHGKSILII